MIFAEENPICRNMLADIVIHFYISIILRFFQAKVPKRNKIIPFLIKREINQSAKQHQGYKQIGRRFFQRTNMIQKFLLDYPIDNRLREDEKAKTIKYRLQRFEIKKGVKRRDGTWQMDGGMGIQ